MNFKCSINEGLQCLFPCFVRYGKASQSMGHAPLRKHQKSTAAHVNCSYQMEQEASARIEISPISLFCSEEGCARALMGNRKGSYPSVILWEESGDNIVLPFDGSRFVIAISELSLMRASQSNRILPPTHTHIHSRRRRHAR